MPKVRSCKLPGNIRDGRYLVYSQWQVENIIPQERWDDYRVVGPMSAGDYEPQVNYAFGAWDRGYNAVSNKNRYPQVTMRWIDYWYETNNSLELAEGPIGVRLIEQPDGTVDIAPPPPGLGAGDWRHTDTLGASSPFAILSETYRDYFPNEAAARKGTIIDEYYAPYWPEEFWPEPLLSAAALRELNPIRTDIDAYVEKTMAEWITDGGIDAGWEEYQSTLERMGLSRMLEIYQEGYDTMVKAAGGSIERPF